MELQQFSSIQLLVEAELSDVTLTGARPLVTTGTVSRAEPDQPERNGAHLNWQCCLWDKSTIQLQETLMFYRRACQCCVLQVCWRPCDKNLNILLLLLWLFLSSVYFFLIIIPAPYLLILYVMSQCVIWLKNWLWLKKRIFKFQTGFLRCIQPEALFPRYISASGNKYVSQFKYYFRWLLSVFF